MRNTTGLPPIMAATLLRTVAESTNGIHEPTARLGQQVGQLQAIVRSLCAEFTGDGAKPQAGCSFYTATAGDASVLLEYEYQPPEDAVYDLDSPMCGPGHAFSVAIIQALVNGRWCDPADVFSESLIEQAREAREPPERDRYDDEHDFAASQDERAELRGGAYAAALGAMK